MCKHSCSLDYEPRERRRAGEDQLHLSMWASLWGLWERRSKTWWNRKWRGNFIVPQSKRKSRTWRWRQKPLKIGFVKPAKHTTESYHLDFSIPQIWRQKHKVNQGATQHENIKESVRQTGPKQQHWHQTRFIIQQAYLGWINGYVFVSV